MVVQTKPHRDHSLDQQAILPDVTMRKEFRHGGEADRLVVEDEPLMRMNLVEYLAGEGFEVHEAGHAEEALSILEERPGVQIVVTDDVQMPGEMDGRALARYVRDRWPPTILVIASGVEKVAKSDLPTRSAFLSKPFLGATLLRTIESLTDVEE